MDYSPPHENERNSNGNTPAIAIVGIGCRFPGKADGPEAFWHMLLENVCAINEFPADRFNSDLFYSPDPDVPQHSITKWGGFVDGITEFDAEFFGISPREAEAMDPQQRALLHVTWDAFEDAGIAPDRLAGSHTGVFVGVCMDDYKSFQRVISPDVDVSHLPTGFGLSIVSNRVSHKFDFHGPSISYDTACSSSLVAVEAACRSLRSGTCKVAVAGGVNVLLDPSPFVTFSGARMLSPTGECLTFDERANGFVRAEGAGAVLLKRLDDALADGDRIYAVIRGAIVNSDGWTSTLTVPNADAQAQMFRDACSQAGVSTAEVDYIEAHGTGTPVGDPIEAHAIGTVFGKDRHAGDPPVVGSVKTNIGHMEAAAGVGGLIKAALSLKNEEIPANPNFRTLNPNIPIDELNIDIATTNRPWPRCKRPRRAVVNSFGFGGTNACVVLEEAPASAIKRVLSSGQTKGPWIIPLSAATPSALTKVANDLADYLDAGKKLAPRMDDIAASLALNRAHLPQRLALISKSRKELVNQLRTFSAGSDEIYTNQTPPRLFTGRRSDSSKTAFAFSGQGSQWFGMARRLLTNDPVFREAVEEVDVLLQKKAGWSVIEELERPKAETRIDETIYTQGCIFAVQVGLFRRWQAWGVNPDIVVGHSLGEIAAAYACGALSLNDCVTIVHYRSSLQAETEGLGAIVAIGLSAEAVQSELDAREETELEIGAINGDQMVTVSGEKWAMDRFIKALRKDIDGDVFIHKIRMNFAPHSPQMEPIKERFISGLAHLSPQAAKIPFVSTVTGENIAGELLNADYWWRNIRQPVLFQNAVQTISEMGTDLIFEVGPDAPLSGLIATCAAEMGAQKTIVRSQKKGQNELLTLNAALCEYYVSGGTLSWENQVGKRYKWLDLPGYPFEKKEFWIDRRGADKQLLAPTPHPLLGRRLDQAQPTWNNTLTLSACKYLEDHVVNESCIFPAAGYFEIMFAVCRELFGDGPIDLENIEFTRANFLDPEISEYFQTHFDEARRRITISSRPADHDSEWEIRAFATVSSPGPGPDIPEQPTQIDGEPQSYRGSEFYRMAAERGYEYGKGFQGVKFMQVSDDEITANLKLPRKAAQSDTYIVHPSVLDSVLQCGIGHLFNDKDGTLDKRGVMYLPRSARRMRLERAPSTRMDLYLTRHNTSPEQSENDVTVWNPKGQVILKLEGYNGLAVRRNIAEKAEEGAVPHFYLDEMVPISAPEPAENKEAGTWLLLADKRGLAETLAKGLRRKGNRVVQVTKGKTYQGIKRGKAQLDPHRPDDFVHLINDVAKSEPPLAGIVFIWPCDLAYARARNKETAASLMRAQTSVTTPALNLVKALTETMTFSAPLFFVTRGAKLIEAHDEKTGSKGLANSTLTGFARTAFSELQLLRSKSIDLGLADALDVQAKALLAEVNATTEDKETEVAIRAGQRFGARFSARAEESLEPRQVTAHSDRGDTGYALTMTAPGDLGHLIVSEAEPEKPGPKEISIAVRAVGLNFRDVMAATGLLPPDAEDKPAWRHLGMECAGIVEAVGKGVKRLKVGDPVIATARGCFKSSLVLPELGAWKQPEGVTHIEAATLLSAFSTAYYALITIGRLRKGERVLIHLATGGVGLAAVQIAKMVGAEIFATAGSPEKRDYLRAMGIKHVMNSRTLDFADETLSATDGRGVDVVLNALAGEAIERGISILAPCGRFLEIGKRDIYSDSPIGMRALRKNISFMAIDMARMGEDNPQGLAEVFEEIGKLLDDGKLKPIPAEVYSINEAKDAFEQMAKGRHIGKVVVTMEPNEAKVALSAEKPIQFDSDAAYLITGGLGGFGLEVAVWMADHGARHIYLMSRSGEKSEAAKAGLKRLKAAGAAPVVIAGDVTKLDDVADTFGRIARDGHALRGLIHAAVVYDDGLIPQLNEDRMNAVMAAKIQGAWNLHSATREMDLDFFTMFSTASVALGNVGQANYVAANMFLESLARFRKAQGLPATALAWGVLGGAGLVERNRELMKFLESSGTPPMPLNVSLKALGTALRKDVPVVTFSAIDWNKFALVSQHVVEQPRLAVQADGNKSGGDQAAYLEVMAAPKSERPAIVTRYLIKSIARVLKLDPERIEPEIPLQDLGLDSLTGLQLKNRAETEFRTTLQVATFLQKPTVSKITEVLVKSLDSSDDGGKAYTKASAAARLISIKQNDILAQLDAHPDSLSYLRGFEYANAIEVRPRLDIKKLRQGLAQIAEQQPIIAACFPKKRGKRILGKTDISKMVVTKDCKRMDEAAFLALLQDRTMTPMDPGTGPLYRYEVFHRRGDCDVLLIRKHGLIMDGASIALAMELELSLLAGRSGGPSSLLNAMSYNDFSDWQRKYLASPKGRSQLMYWSRKLSHPGPELSLPFDFKREHSVPQHASSMMLSLGSDLVDKIRNVAKAHKTSTFSALMAIYALLLSPYSNSANIFISTTASGRTRSEMESTLGPLSNVVTLRIPSEPGRTGLDFLVALDDDLKQSLAQQDYPISEIRRELKLADREANTLNQVSFSMLLPQTEGNFDTSLLFGNLDGVKLELGEASAETIVLPVRGARRDLAVQVVEVHGKVLLRFDYDAGLFKPGTIKALMNKYQSIAKAFVKNPQAHCSDLIEARPRKRVSEKVG